MRGRGGTRGGRGSTRRGRVPGLGEDGLGEVAVPHRGPGGGGLRQLAQQLRRGGPVAGLLGQGGLDQRVQPGRHGGDVGRGVHDPVQDDVGRPGPERRLPAGRVGDRHGPGEDVRRRPGLADDLLGRHEPGRAERDAGLGEAGRVQRLGDAEVDDLRAARGEEHVGGLEVPMHDPGRVDRRQRLRQPGRQAVQHPGVERPAGVDVLRQRGSVGVLGDQERFRRLGIGLDHPDRAYALDPGQHGDLTAEPDPELRVVGQFGAQHLHRDLLASGILAEVHDAHPACAQPGHQAVPPDLRRVRLPQRRASQRSPFRPVNGSPEPPRAASSVRH